jgi:DNA-binding response OmpR family regulator
MRRTADIQILIVEDDDLLRDTMAFDFERRGFQVLKAPSGKAAIEHMETKVPSLVISDMQMPDGDGLSLLKRTRKMAPPPIFILVTGYSDQREADLIDHGVYRIFVKPYRRQLLMECVLEALGLK